MKKIILTLVFCMATAGISFAQNNTEAMRFLTINALVQYGHQLYERGDYNGAGAVFKHVLTYDGHQAQALQYLKDMGYAPQPQDSMAVEKPNFQLLDGGNAPNAKELKKAIETEKQVIKKLQDQIIRMRANIASQSSKQQ